MGEKRQKNQEQLAFPFAWGSEASRSEREGTEMPRGKREAEDPAENQRVMEEVCEGEKRGSESEPTRGVRGSTGAAAKTAGSRCGPWRVRQSPAMDRALSNA
jgi:hypothetical protein